MIHNHPLISVNPGRRANIGTLCVIDQKPGTLDEEQKREIQAHAKHVQDRIQEELDMGAGAPRIGTQVCGKFEQQRALPWGQGQGGSFTRESDFRPGGILQPSRKRPLHDTAGSPLGPCDHVSARAALDTSGGRGNGRENGATGAAYAGSEGGWETAAGAHVSQLGHERHDKEQRFARHRVDTRNHGEWVPRALDAPGPAAEQRFKLLESMPGFETVVMKFERLEQLQKGAPG